MSDTTRADSTAARSGAPPRPGAPDVAGPSPPPERRPGAGPGLDSLTPPDPQAELAEYVSEAGAESVWVRRDSNGETVRAIREGYPAGFVFEPGDETGIELVDGAWRTIPSIAYTVRLNTRVEWWTRNRSTGGLRFLVERSLR